MGKKKKRNPPSRKKYEQENPTISFRAPKRTKERLAKHLEGTGQSVLDFVEDALGREESMVEKRVEMLASRQAGPALEERVRFLESLVHEVFMLTVDTKEYPPLCPHCENQEMRKCEGRQIESSMGCPWVPTWKCPKCGYFLNTYKRIDPESIELIEPEGGRHIDKPGRMGRRSPKKRLKERK